MNIHIINCNYLKPEQVEQQLHCLDISDPNLKYNNKNH